MPDWDLHYSDREVADLSVASVLTDNQHLLPATGTALDYACGLAANGRWLSQQGFQVTAWDASSVAIDKVNHYCQTHNINLQAEVHDLERAPLPETEVDVLVVSFYLHRPTLKQLAQLLKPGGLLFYQTFCGKQRNGRGPGNPSFRLESGELLDVFDDLQVLYYREDSDYGPADQGLRDQAMIVAARS